MEFFVSGINSNLPSIWTNAHYAHIEYHVLLNHLRCKYREIVDNSNDVLTDIAKCFTMLICTLIARTGNLNAQLDFILYPRIGNDMVNEGDALRSHDIS